MSGDPAASGPCPTEDELLAVVGGFVDVEAEARVRAHLDGCAACTTLVAEAGRALASATPGEDGPPAANLARRRNPGDKLGRYLILEPIGQGAMGVVYAAYDPELDRKVALKHVRPDRHLGLDVAEVGQRLQREAQSMARISHPNVLPIFDVGVVDDGVFLAMELATGGTLRRWLAARRRPWREILAAFQQAGRGLAAAHRTGIVHRDFKPDNVLFGDGGRAMVTDFGLARLDVGAAGDDPAATALRLTHVGALVGTPAYMAPEQFLAGQAAGPARPAPAVDARADQFAFCTALYEALCRIHPFPTDSIPSLRSAVLAGALQSPPRDAAVPRFVMTALRRGLRPDPDLRFPDMDRLLAALDRDPRRHLRWAVPLALAVALGGAAVAIAGRDRPPRARIAACVRGGGQLDLAWTAARQRDLAARFASVSPVLGADTAARVANVLSTWTTSWHAARVEACAATEERGEQSAGLLDRRLHCLDERAQDAAALIDQFVVADAATVERAVLAATSLTPIAMCSDRQHLLDATPLPADPGARAQVDGARAQVATLAALDQAGRYADGRDRAPAALAATQATGWPPVEAEALLWQGRLTAHAGDPGAAAAPLFAAAAAATRAGRDDLAAAAWIELATLTTSSSAKEVDQLLRWLDLAAAHAQHGGDPPRLRAQLLTARARVHLGAMQADRALPLVREALAILERELGPDHPLVAETTLVLELALMQLGQHREAATLARRGADLVQKAYGPAHPAIARHLFNQATALTMLGKNEEALAADREALAIQEAALGPQHRAVGETLHSMAWLHANLGQSREALALFRRSLAIKEGALGPDHLDLFNSLASVAPVACDAGEPATAATMLDRAEALLRLHGVEEDEPRWGTLYLIRAQVAERLGHYPEADRAWLRARAVYERGKALPGDLAQCKAGHARQLLRQGRATEAVVLLREALAVEEQNYGAGNPGLSDSLLPLGEGLLATGHRAEGLAVLRRALANLDGQAVDPVAEAEIKSAVALALAGDPSTRAEAEALMARVGELARSRPFLPQPIRDRMATWARLAPAKQSRTFSGRR